MALPLRTAHPAPGDARELCLAIVVAIASNGVIGRDGTLPWHLPEDLRHFRALTLGHAVVMGRRTWQSLRGPLPGRQNLVVTRQRDFAAEGAEVAGSLDEALVKVTRPQPVFCMGGAELYAQALPRADLLHITEIQRAFPGDTFFPPFDRALFREVERVSHRSESDLGYDFVTCERIAPAR